MSAPTPHDLSSSVSAFSMAAISPAALTELISSGEVSTMSGSAGRASLGATSCACACKGTISMPRSAKVGRKRAFMIVILMESPRHQAEECVVNVFPTLSSKIAHGRD